MTSATPSEAELGPHVARAVRTALGPTAGVRAIRRAPSPFATFFAAEVLTVELDRGGELRLFVKHFDAREPDHPEKLRRDRELRVYAELLTDASLPVPRCYATEWDDERRCGVLVLEHVDDWNLKYQDLAHWYTAAGRLAALHAHFASRPLGEDFLLRFDGAFFSESAARAVEVVGSTHPDLGRRLEAVAEVWQDASAVLAEQPSTLVHNDLAPKNVIADRAQDPARICIVDWEMAGTGCGVLDIVHLDYGFDPASERRMRDAYCSALAGSGLLPAGARQRRAVFAAAALHKTFYRLACANRWALAAPRVAEWVDDAQQLLAQVARA